jgi:hypothetical protein
MLSHPNLPAAHVGGFVDRGTIVVIEHDGRPVAACGHWTNGTGSPSTEQLHLLFPDSTTETGVGAWPGDRRHGVNRVRIWYVMAGSGVTQAGFQSWLDGWLSFHRAQDVPRWSRTVSWTALGSNVEFGIPDATPGFRSRYYVGSKRAKNAQYWIETEQAEAQVQFRCAAWLVPDTTVVGLKYQEYRWATSFGSWKSERPAGATRYAGIMTLANVVPGP